MRVCWYSAVALYHLEGRFQKRRSGGTSGFEVEEFKNYES